VKLDRRVLIPLSTIHIRPLPDMANLPFRDINVHASTSHYAFTSPSNPSAPTLVIERPSGELRLNDGALLGAKRVSSIAGILGIIKLKLGTLSLVSHVVCKMKC
jgi:hypothetical protein